MISNNKIALIGAGSMGVSLIQGLLKANISPDNLYASHPNPEKLKQLSTQWGIAVCQDNREAANHARVIILCVKPDKIPAVVEEIKEIILTQSPLMISLAAGISTTVFESLLGRHHPIVRAMPNLPAMIGAAATGLYANGLVSENEKNMTESIFRSVGLAVWVDHEKALNAITALSGSGPAYVYYLMEAMESAALELGLSYDMAKILIVQTVFGASKLALESDDSLTALRERVTSPKGTTEAAMDILAAHDVFESIKQAIKGAAIRAETLIQS
jgi:pyrroline-5-carboxylate reductase